MPLPPDPPVVIARSLCLASLLVRGYLESTIRLACGPSDAAAYAELARRLSRWLNDQEFTAHFTGDELEALSENPGTWSTERHQAHGSRLVAMEVLLWALGIAGRITSYDEPCPEPDLEPLLGWPPEALAHPTHSKLAAFPCHGGAWLATASQPRSPEVIHSLRTVAHCWQWRAQVAALQRANTPLPPGQDYAMMVAIAAEEAYTASAIPRPVGEDFPFLGRPFGKAAVETQERTASIAQARRLALDWLSGYATPWDQVPVACSQAA